MVKYAKDPLILKFWANLPMFILFGLSLYIYLTYMMTYVVKLLTNTYESSSSSNGQTMTLAPTVFLTMQTVTGLANHLVEKVQIEYNDFSAMQKKGLIYLFVCHVAFILYAISTLRTICTKPGYVPGDWNTKAEESIRAAIITERRILQNLQKSMTKRHNENKSSPAAVIVEARASQECDFLVDRDQESTKDPDSESNSSKHIEAEDLFKKISSKGEISTPKKSAADDDEDPLMERNDLKEELEKLNENSATLTADRIDQIAELSAMRRENKRFCAHCQKFKPERTHHCKQCGLCVLKMDHHCPWVNNCIGFYNYKYFLNMLFWGSFGLLFIALTFTEAVVDSLFDLNTSVILSYTVLLGYVLTTVMATLLTAFFFFFHLCDGVATVVATPSLKD